MPPDGHSARFVSGIDIGGTFTDCAVVDGAGRVVTSKVPSTPAEPDAAFVQALDAASGALGLDLATLLAGCDQIMHGTTVATNAVIERTGASVGLIATAGHGEAILHMRGAGRTAGVSIERMLDIPGSSKPAPLVPRGLIREVPERVDSDGEVVVGLDEVAARVAIESLRDASVEAIAVSLLWSFLNPVHERRVRELIEQLAPGLYVSVSHELAPVMGEYERTVATVLNAYVGPKTRRYLEGLGVRMGAEGYARDVLVVESTGGVAPAGQATGEALLTLGSGPVAGMIGTKFLGEALGMPNVIAVDMGGTSFDVGIVRDGEPLTTDSSTVDQYEYHVPNVEVRSIGAGGGSIASVDEASGGLLVGPRSAGAQPGPACYGRGGTEATVTDADLVLGYLDPGYFLGGEMRLEPRLAEGAVDRIAGRLGLSRLDTAAGIATVIEFRMADLIRAMTVQRGFDPRDFTLFVYGGAGGTHGAVLARELGIASVVVPMGTVAGVWSALGAATADVVHVHQRSDPQAAPFDVARLGSVYGELEREARARLEDEGFAGEAIALARRASLRYRYQIHEIEIDAPPALHAAAAGRLTADFERAYAELYGEGSGYSAAGVELTTLKVVGTGSLRRMTLSGASPAAAPEPRAVRTRRIYSAQRRTELEAAVYHGEDLRSGARIEGPAIVEQPWTTVVVPPGTHAEVDGLLNLVIHPLGD